jgi:hypothetical protein
MSDTPYAVERKIMGKKYSILLTHKVGAKVDLALKQRASVTGVKSNFTTLLRSLVEVTINLVGRVLTPEQATQAVYNVLDLDTIFMLLPLVIEQEIDEDDIDLWLQNAQGEGVDLFTLATWLGEAAITANIVTVQDPKLTLLIYRLLRGVATEADKAELLATMEAVTLSKKEKN